MNYLIDGHNLIGSNLFSDIRLSDVDDEAKLVARLKIWQSRVLKSSNSTMTVVFDRGLPGGKDVKMGGVGVEVVFATDPVQADDLIRRRLRKAKQGLILVSNDEALLREASANGVTGWRGEEFVARMKPKIPDRAEAGTESNVQVSKEDVDEWMALFRAAHQAKKAKQQRPTSADTKMPPEEKGSGADKQSRDSKRKNSSQHNSKSDRIGGSKGGSKGEDKR